MVVGIVSSEQFEPGSADELIERGRFIDDDRLVRRAIAAHREPEQRASDGESLFAPPEAMNVQYCLHHFTCNICGSKCTAETLDREIPSCPCGSNVRFRWVVHAVSMELFGQSLPLKKFPRSKHVRGLGLSDTLLFSNVFSKRFDYQNTCLDREPRFDIMIPNAAPEGAYDFVIASEVFEHVPPPVQTAFDNLARLLKPNGIAVFSSPWESTGNSVEHFPDLHDWQVVALRSGYVLLNRTIDSRLETFDDLVFHGGPGNTLEMRVFAKDDLLENIRAAGLQVDFAEDNPDWGIVWEPWSRGMVLRRRG